MLNPLKPYTSPKQVLVRSDATTVHSGYGQICRMPLPADFATPVRMFISVFSPRKTTLAVGVSTARESIDVGDRALQYADGRGPAT